MSSGEKMCFNFFLYFSLWDLDTKGLGDSHSFFQYKLIRHLDVPGNVVGIRNIEGNQKFKGFNFMELTFHEEDTINT